MTEKPSRSTESVEGDTRRLIMSTLLKHGPMTASELGDRLGFSAAGVRRHLDILLDEGLADSRQRRPLRGVRGRGRPAKSFALTDKGRAHFGHKYDVLADMALAALRLSGGDQAIKDLARMRIRQIIAGVGQAGDSPESVEATARELAKAFDDNGYAATVKKAPGGVQICQHHCPVSHVAAQHPEICEAEHQIIAELTGLHVQPLASIAEGHGVCTTNIPLTPITTTPEERSGS
ncbi:helix-turn-helix transcriptional regulator [Corynebacterium caspium]|uniref:helix-turn-helix transcriptional regulator n=1 Tax=Corynebacterium caspium TaxID=234828 RepID=UPI0004773F55|nr:metalloregulator ArsR/SmtB family transcription factor [Corynebacterium caspium]WKD59264.1 Bacterial regulatory protein, arsR family [Corynebacterium caspium DSM 44850]